MLYPDRSIGSQSACQNPDRPNDVDSELGGDRVISETRALRSRFQPIAMTLLVLFGLASLAVAPTTTLGMGVRRGMRRGEALMSKRGCARPLIRASSPNYAGRISAITPRMLTTSTN